MYQHLLVPLDGSELSERATQTSLDLARKLGARITAFVAEPLPPLPHMGDRTTRYAGQTDAHMARTQAHAQDVLGRFKARAEAAGVPFEGRFTRTEAVEDAIVNTAKDAGCDLIVMVTHGRGVFGELLFGSHTRKVFELSKLPLLVLH